MKTQTPIVDAHVHIFPPELIARREELLERDSWFGEAFGHPKAKLRTVEELIASMDKAGVDISITVGWPWQENEICAIHNNYHAECARRYPDRIKWLGTFNPVDTGAIDEITRCADLGATGYGELNADGQGFRWSNPIDYREAITAIAALGLPLMTHTSEPVGHIYPGKGSAHPQEILTAIETVPVVKWVLAHWGGGLPFYELMPEVKIACANVAYDSAATSYLYNQDVFRHVVDIVGVEKVLFASDWPVLAQGRLINRVRDAGLTDDELREIMGQNALRVYGIT